RSVPKTSVGVSERRRVGDVECLGAKFCPETLGNSEDLTDHHIRRSVSWSRHWIPGTAADRELRSLRKRRCIEVARGTALIRGQVWIGAWVRTLYPEATESVQVGCLCNRQGTAGLHPYDTRELPASCQHMLPSAQRASPAVSEWQFVYEAARQNMGHVA